MQNHIDKFNYKRINSFLMIMGFFLLEYSYFDFISKNYDLFDFEFNLIRYISVKVLFLIVLYFVNKIKSPFMYVMSMIFLFMMLIPNMILYQFTEIHFSIVAFIILFELLLVFFDNFNIVHKRQIVFLKNHKSVVLLVFVLLLLIPYFITYKFDLNFSVIKLGRNVYEQRELINTKAGTFIKYTMSWIAKIILPILLLISLRDKKRKIFVVTLLLMFYMFFTLAHKTMLFAPIIALAFYFVPNFKAQTSMITLGFVVLILSSRFVTEYIGELQMEATFVRRLFFIPAILNESYIDFFYNKPLYFSNSILSSFLDYPYRLEPSYLIADVYWDGSKAHANNGFISDGFMHMGYFGIFLFTLIISIIIKLFDSLKIDSRFHGVYMLTIFTFISSAFLTSLLTHGVLLLIILSFLFLHNSNKEKYI